MIVVRYRTEADERSMLSKLKKMKSHIEDFIECIENKDGEYEEYEDEDEYYERNNMSRRGSMNRRSNMTRRGRYDY